MLADRIVSKPKRDYAGSLRCGGVLINASPRRRPSVHGKVAYRKFPIARVMGVKDCTLSSPLLSFALFGASSGTGDETATSSWPARGRRFSAQPPRNHKSGIKESCKLDRLRGLVSMHNVKSWHRGRATREETVNAV